MERVLTILATVIILNIVVDWLGSGAAIAVVGGMIANLTLMDK